MSLVADADAVGHKAMEGLAKHLHGLGCKVKIALPPVEWDNDIADWITEQGKEEAAKIIGGLLKDYQPPVDDPQLALSPTGDTQPTSVETVLQEAEKVVAHYGKDQLRDNAHYRLLGLVGTSIAVRLREAGVVYEKPREQFTQTSTLIALAPATWWCGWAQEEELSQRLARKLGDTIIREADALGQIDQSLFWGRARCECRTERSDSTLVTGCCSKGTSTA